MNKLKQNSGKKHKKQLEIEDLEDVNGGFGRLFKSFGWISEETYYKNKGMCHKCKKYNKNCTC